jgi:hypothetical protein
MAAHSTLRNNPPTDTAIAGLLLNTWIKLAYNQWKEANSKSKGSLFVNKAAKNYYIVKSTLRRRIIGGASRKQAS